MKPIIVWFRQDLRLSDNPALIHAAETGSPLICLYVLDDEIPGDWRWGGASRWWLHHSLAALDKSLKAHKGRLVLRRGRADQIVKALVRDSGADMVVWNRCYEPFAVARDTALKSALTADGIDVQSFNTALLFEPWEIKTGSGTPFRVFTPFWNALRAKGDPGKPQPVPRELAFQKGVESDALKDWKLLPTKPDWAKGFDWTPGEEAARQTLYHCHHHTAQ